MKNIKGEFADRAQACNAMEELKPHCISVEMHENFLEYTSGGYQKEFDSVGSLSVPFVSDYTSLGYSAETGTSFPAYDYPSAYGTYSSITVTAHVSEDQYQPVREKMLEFGAVLVV